MIRAHNISYSVKGKNILDNISLKAEAGEVLVILGGNGAGKSTLLRVLCGDLDGAPGDVSIQNKPLHSWKTAELAQFRAVLAQQTIIGLPYLVKDIVMMGRYPHFKKSPANLDYIIVRNALKKTGIDHLAERNYLTLSGGEQQRVQLARVLAQVWFTEKHAVRYLLMDEPVNSLDIVHQHTTLRLAREFAQEGNCVITVLHDLNLAAQYADKILLLRNGSVLASGTPEEVLMDELMSSTYDFPLSILHHSAYKHPVIIPAIFNHQTSIYNGSNLTGSENTI